MCGTREKYSNDYHEVRCYIKKAIRNCHFLQCNHCLLIRRSTIHKRFGTADLIEHFCWDQDVMKANDFFWQKRETNFDISNLIWTKDIVHYDHSKLLLLLLQKCLLIQFKIKLGQSAKFLFYQSFNYLIFCPFPLHSWGTVVSREISLRSSAIGCVIPWIV